MDRLAIEFICVFGMPPVEFIELAAELDCPRIGLAPAPIVTLPGLYEAWDLRTDAVLRRDTAKALKSSPPLPMTSAAASSSRGSDTNGSTPPKSTVARRTVARSDEHRPCGVAALPWHDDLEHSRR